jgi:nitrate/nitrite transport system substrate-binding protein
MMTQDPERDTEPSTRGGISRRNFLRGSLGMGLALGTGLLGAACGADSTTSGGTGGATGAPIKIGFIPLTDCGSVVMASTLGLYEKYGVKVEVLKEASWANVRDKLLTGELDAAHCLFGMPFSVFNGIGGKQGSELKIAMMINNNGQAITVRKEIAPMLTYGSADGIKAMVEQLRASKEPTFAMTFPGGTHDLWMRYWLGAGGLKNDEVKLITIPPPQMVANMEVGSMDAFCVGEPWGGVAVKKDIGATAITTQDMWEHHPEKALVVNANFAATRREDLKKVMKAVLEASIWLDTMSNRAEAARVLGGQAYVNAPADVLEDRLMGNYNLGAIPGDDDALLPRWARQLPAQIPRHLVYGPVRPLRDAQGAARRQEDRRPADHAGPLRRGGRRAEDRPARRRYEALHDQARQCHLRPE